MTDLLTRGAAVDLVAGMLPSPTGELATIVVPCRSDATLDILAAAEDAGFTPLRSQLGRLENRRAAMRAVACGGDTLIVVEDNGLEPLEPLLALTRDLSVLRLHSIVLVVTTTGDPARFEGLPSNLPLPRAA